AIDNALHSISQHFDGGGYVRMTTDERSKLSFIAPHATDFGLSVQTISGVIIFDDGLLSVKPSDSITWRYQSGSLYADTSFPSSVRHVHYYGITPVVQSLTPFSHQTYSTTTVFTPYKQGSLRVYINGVRLQPG